MKKVKVTREVKEAITDEWTFDYHYAQRKPLSVCIASSTFRDSNYTGIGVAKCLSRDPWDSHVGFEIAMTRAKRQIMHDIVRDHFA